LAGCMHKRIRAQIGSRRQQLVLLSFLSGCSTVDVHRKCEVQPMRRELYARDQVVLVRHKKRRASLLPRQIGVNDHRKWPDLHQNTARAIMNVETSPGMGGVGCAHILKILISRQSNVKHTSYSYTWCLRCFRLHLEICGSKNPRRYA
jgi:hypothetical protein